MANGKRDANPWCLKPQHRQHFCGTGDIIHGCSKETGQEIWNGDIYGLWNLMKIDL